MSPIQEVDVNRSTPLLIPLSRKSRKACPCERIELRELPFRIGRETRLYSSPWHMKHGERRKGLAAPNNDLYLEQVGKAHYISREHAQIERRDDGSYYVVDRSSICGTTVGGTFVGGTGLGGECLLQDGDTVILGPPRSPYRFRFNTCSDPAHVKAHRSRRHHRGSQAWLGILAAVVSIASIIVHGFML